MTTPTRWELPTADILPGGLPMPREPLFGPVPAASDMRGLSVTPLGRPAAAQRVVVSQHDWLGSLDRLFVLAAADYGLTVSVPFRGTSKVVLRHHLAERIDALRPRLGLTAAQLAGVLGLKPRRLYELMGGERFPATRLAEIEERLAVLDALGSRDVRAAHALIRGRYEETLKLLDEQRYGDLLELFNEVRRERDELLRTGRRRADPIELAAVDLDDVATLASAAGFETTAQIVQWFGDVDAVADRTRLAVELAATFEAIESGDAINEAYDFLFTLDETGRERFKERALAYLRDGSVDGDSWTAFLSKQYEASSQARGTVELEPPGSSVDDSQEEESLAWQPDLTRLRTDLRLHDRRSR